jgi:DNA-binding response OmpR family regulator
MPHILVVDDDADLLELVTLVLKRSDYQVTALQDGTKVFPIVEDINPDVILMDIYLGNTDGRNICKDLKSSDKFNAIPVILYSAGNITAQSIRDAMADSFIVKPFNNAEILEKIQSLQPGR